MAQQLVKLRRKKRMSSSPQTQSSSSTPTHRHPNLSAPSMLERTLSSRRVNSYADDDADADVDADESKTKKNQHILFRITTRASNYLSRIAGSGSFYLPCVTIVLFVFFAFSFLFTSRGFVCISSSYTPVSRAGFFGFDGLDSDFGSLGVPCCKSLCSDLISSSAIFAFLSDLMLGSEMCKIKNN